MTQGSGFWVGPANAPDSYELVALLGAGGEGEVWRAIAPSGETVAIKIIPGPADEAWLGVLQQVMSVSHPGLARIDGYFAGGSIHRPGELHQNGPSYRYVLMEFVHGDALDQWIADNPDARPGLIKHILRPVAGALDALHQGTSSVGAVVHGDVKPSNIIVTKDGTGVLVDVGLANVGGIAATTGHTPGYAAPELIVNGEPGTVQTDSYAFVASLAASLAGGRPPIDRTGLVDLTLLRSWLAASSRLRLRPLWRRRIHAALTARPGKRPVRLQRWLDAPTRGGIAAAIVAVLIVAVATTSSALAGHDGRKRPEAVPTAPLAQAPTSTSSSASFGIEAANSEHPTKSSAKRSPSDVTFTLNSMLWPYGAGCQTVTTVSGQGRVDPRGESYEAIRGHLLQRSDAGAWLGGVVTGSFQTSAKIHIVAVRIVIIGDPGAPGFIYQPGGALPGLPVENACGTSAVPGPTPLELNEVFSVDGKRSADIGADLAAGQEADLLAHVSSCNGNARFRIAVDYTVPGSAVVRTWTDDQHTFVVYGTASGTEYDIGYETAAGTIVMTSRVVSGHQADCPGATAPTFREPKVDPASAASLTATPRTSTPQSSTKVPPPSTSTPPPSSSTPPSSDSSTSEAPSGP